jgi:hypothetical protein
MCETGFSWILLLFLVKRDPKYCVVRRGLRPFESVGHHPAPGERRTVMYSPLRALGDFAHHGDDMSGWFPFEVAISQFSSKSSGIDSKERILKARILSPAACCLKE